MFRIAKPFFLKVVTPLHAGSGQDLGIIDLPIQRERHTGFPKIEASGLKGSIREIFRENAGNEAEKLKELNLIFGDEDAAHAGAIGFSDARLLLFPVKSMKGVFAYITCSLLLKKFKGELDLCNISKQIPTTNSVNNGECHVSDKDFLGLNENVILEEYTFKIANNCPSIAQALAEITGIDGIGKRLVILSDDDFKDFVNLSTEVITRTKIDTKTGTVIPGALFTEEYLPAETVMYSLTLASPVFTRTDNDLKSESQVMKYFIDNIPSVIQIGGNATLGKGIVQIITFGEE
ncbi:MAG: type III-B CRISPR module RAMP protein Cmr4 [Candidatus Cloacimonetes bacterium]|nr:type III-B CRISPR module RAMP protein Cmr4 [Candidatus Cloacimonadota bacterium]